MGYEKELELEGGSLYYRSEEDSIHITRCSRLNGEIRIPDTIDGLPVTVIRKKAFLSQKKLKRVFLPATLQEIGEWAFAFCSRLEEAVLPQRKLRRGKGIFQECKRLERITVYKGETMQDVEKTEQRRTEAGTETEMPREQAARLLASAAVMLDAEYLLEPVEAGSSEWLFKWDARLQELLQREESEGYTKTILCGEEDLDSDLETYQKEVRREKARLCLKRLMNPYGLKGPLKEQLTEFLLSHTKGCETEEAWEVLLFEHGDEREYYAFFCELGAIHAGNRSAVLLDMGEEHAEMKAFVIQQGQEETAGESFFAGLSL